MKTNKGKADRVGLGIGVWRLVWNGNAAEIFRTDLVNPPHLTIYWAGSAGGLHVHLTRDHEMAMAGLSPKKHETIIELSREELDQVALRAEELISKVIVPPLLAGYMKYRPGWLARQGYVVFPTATKVLRPWLASAAPKARGKFHLRPEMFLEPTNYPPELVENVWDPGILNDLAGSGETGPVSAVRFRRGQVVQRDSILLNHTLGPDGSVSWWGSKYWRFGTIYKAIPVILGELLAPLLLPEHLTKLEAALVEVGVEATSAQEIVRALDSIWGTGMGKQPTFKVLP